MAFYAGRDANFTANGVSNRCTKWDFDVERGKIDVTYMGSGSKWRKYIVGFNGGKISAQGPHEPNLALPWESDSITYSLLIGGAFTISGNAIVNRIGVGTDIENAAIWRMELTPDGAPTIA